MSHLKVYRAVYRQFLEGQEVGGGINEFELLLVVRGDSKAKYSAIRTTHSSPQKKAFQVFSASF